MECQGGVNVIELLAILVESQVLGAAGVDLSLDILRYRVFVWLFKQF